MNIPVTGKRSVIQRDKIASNLYQSLNQYLAGFTEFHSHSMIDDNLYDRIKNEVEVKLRRVLNRI